MALYIPRSIFHLAWLLYVRPETFGPTPVYINHGHSRTQNRWNQITAYFAPAFVQKGILCEFAQSTQIIVVT